ncbi:hypothetical protein [Hydrogenophaga luteola]|uniref:Uncharacterized protein n=1 Tax=Hydrogenophaga luteola TaxID=1591122 RepID=A0ABV7W0D7_9BURK
MKRLFLACALSLHFLVQATTLPSIELSQLFRDADIVALVEVASGETIGTGEKSCGAKYAALVVDGFKGVSAGETIEFGNYYGYEIGSRYVLFLVGPGRKHEPVMSTNSMHRDAQAEHEKRCASRLRRNTVMHSGNGALRVHWVTDFQYKDGVAVPTRYVVLPSTIPTIPAKITETNEFSSEVWVRLPELADVLRGMGK